MDGEEIAQSKTIERYVAKMCGFLGANEMEGAKIDAITEHVRDIKQKYQDAKKGKKDEDLAKAKTEYLTDTLPPFMEKLEKVVSTQGYAVGNKVSLADLTLRIFIKDFFDDKGVCMHKLYMYEP